MPSWNSQWSGQDFYFKNMLENWRQVLKNHEIYYYWCLFLKIPWVSCRNVYKRAKASQDSCFCALLLKICWPILPILQYETDNTTFSSSEFHIMHPSIWYKLRYCFHYRWFELLKAVLLSSTPERFQLCYTGQNVLVVTFLLSLSTWLTFWVTKMQTLYDFLDKRKVRIIIRIWLSLK